MKTLKSCILFILIIVPTIVFADPSDHIEYPEQAILRVKLQETIGVETFVKELVCSHYNGTENVVSFAFNKISDFVFEAVVDNNTPLELQNLRWMCEFHHRNFWDRMALESRSDPESISIGHLYLRIDYEGNPAHGRRDITIIDQHIDRELDELDLELLDDASLENR